MARKSADEEKKKKKAKAGKEDKPKRKAKVEKEEKPKKKKSKEKDEPKKKAKSKEEEPKRKRKKQDVEEEPERRKSKKELKEGVAASFNPYAALDETLDEIEKKTGLTENSLDPSIKRQSTGNLCINLLLGGGLLPGWYTNVGKEQTCKTSEVVHEIGAALNSNIPIIYYWDAEGSGEPVYLENILHNMGVKSDIKHIFGVRDQKSGEYIVKPRVRYRSDAGGELFFDVMARILRSLPDKIKIGDKWYLVYADDKKRKAQLEGLFDRNYYRKTGKLRVETEDGTAQAFVLLDSLPALLPERMDEEESEGKAGIGAQARMFSDQIKRIKGKLKRKRVILHAVNQIREKPMVMYGSPEYEPCGQAVRFYSDVRMKYSDRALSSVPGNPKGKGQIELEKSVQFKKGDDQYRYIHVRAIKNKLSRPFFETYLRLWITDPKGNAWGFDPVWDTYYYLVQTGQVEGKRTKMRLSIKINDKKSEDAEAYMDWFDFKKLILGDKKMKKTICENIGIRPMNLRELCFKQLSSGYAVELFNNNSSDPEPSEDDEDDEDDDD